MCVIDVRAEMNWIKIGGYILIIIPTLMVGIFLGFYILQDYLIFLGEKLPNEHKYNFSHPFEELNFKQSNDIVLNALLFKCKSPKGLVYYHHGNAGNLQVWGNLAGHFISNNWDVLFYDYRGYGKSSDKIRHEHQLHDDAKFILDEINQAYTYQRIVFFGNSLGTGIASKLALYQEPDGLILETPYYSFTNLVSFHYPFLPAKWITKYHLKTYKFLPKLGCSTLILHGTHDDIVPYKSGERLSLLSENITLVKIPNGVHNNLPDFPLYRNELKNFLDKL